MEGDLQTSTSQSPHAQNDGGRSPVPGPHWTKDYAEHLRSIHFALIVVSAALIVLALSSSTSNIPEALRQIDGIAEVSKQWQEKWLEEAAARKVSGDSAAQLFTPPNAAVVLEVSDKSDKKFVERLDTSFTPPNWVVVGEIMQLRGGDSGSSNFVESYSSSRPAAFVSRPVSLSGFKRIWDALYSGTYVQIAETLADKGYFVRGRGMVGGKLSDVTDGLRSVEFARQRAPSNYDDDAVCSLRRLLSTVKKTLDTSSEYAYACTWDSWEHYALFLPIQRMRKVDLDGLEMLVSRFDKNGYQPSHRDFAHAFRALNDLTKDYQDLDINNFESILRSEQARSGESFEAFGIKFPGHGATAWGIVVILAIQTYFWIHLHEFKVKLDPKDPIGEIAWIGVYPSAASKLVFHLSAFVLPILAVLALGAHGVIVGNHPRLTGH